MKISIAIAYIILIQTALCDTNSLLPPIEDLPLPEISITPELIDVEIAPSYEDQFIRLLISPPTNTLPFEVNERPVAVNAMTAALRKLHSIEPNLSILIKAPPGYSEQNKTILLELLRDTGMTNISIRTSQGTIQKLNDESSNKGLLRTGDPRTSRQSAEP